MTLKFKRKLLLAAAGLLVLVALAKGLLWLMPPRRPLEFMIAGAAVTAAALGIAFARVVMRK